MEEKQEFQLGDTAYNISFNAGCPYSGYNVWNVEKKVVNGVFRNISTGEVILCFNNVDDCCQQKLCGHTFEEAKEIAYKDYSEKYKSYLENLKELKENDFAKD